MKPCKSYSFPWAMCQSESFRRKYVRASEVFRQISGHKEDYPAWLLAHDAAKWNRYKKIVKFVHESGVYDDPAKITPHAVGKAQEDLCTAGLYPVGGVDTDPKQVLLFPSKVS